MPRAGRALPRPARCPAAVAGLPVCGTELRAERPARPAGCSYVVLCRRGPGAGSLLAAAAVTFPVAFARHWRRRRRALPCPLSEAESRVLVPRNGFQATALQQHRVTPNFSRRVRAERQAARTRRRCSVPACYRAGGRAGALRENGARSRTAPRLLRPAAVRAAAARSRSVSAVAAPRAVSVATRGGGAARGAGRPRRLAGRRCSAARSGAEAPAASALVLRAEDALGRTASGASRQWKNPSRAPLLLPVPPGALPGWPAGAAVLRAGPAVTWGVGSAVTWGWLVTQSGLPAGTPGQHWCCWSTQVDFYLGVFQSVPKSEGFVCRQESCKQIGGSPSDVLAYSEKVP